MACFRSEEFHLVRKGSSKACSFLMPVRAAVADLYFLYGAYDCPMMMVNHHCSRADQSETLAAPWLSTTRVSFDR
jgi:hypothetical protein